jgi:hypothetical protein
LPRAQMRAAQKIRSRVSHWRSVRTKSKRRRSPSPSCGALSRSRACVVCCAERAPR